MKRHLRKNYPTDWNLILQKAHEGVSLTKLRHLSGKRLTTVRKFLKKNGIDRPTNYGSPGSKNPAWRGGRITDKQGYVLISNPSHPDARKTGYIFEHRLVMEKHLGRRLEKSEVVHHKNGKVSDNRIQNLELFSSNGAHLRKTKKGCVPKWSRDGIYRMKVAIAQAATAARPQTHAQTARDVRWWPEIVSHS